jgi:hypothetical protein
MFTDVSEVLAIALMMEAASTSETSVNFSQTTRRNIPEDSHSYSLEDRVSVWVREPEADVVSQLNCASPLILSFINNTSTIKGNCMKFITGVSGSAAHGTCLV